VGGFLAFWLAPELMGFQNGTLNFSRDTLEAIRALRKRRGFEGGPGFSELLDQYEVDVFHGIRLPEQLGGGPWYYSTAHLERAPDWLLVFRDLRSCVYLRNNARNRPNLERIAAYYANSGVPFDIELGLKPSRVIRENRTWAVRHGMLPANFETLATNLQSERSDQRAESLDLLASTYVALGLYEEALLLDERLLKLLPNAYRARRRRIWSLIRLDRRQDALAEASRVEAPEHKAPFTLWLARAAEGYAETEDSERAAALAALLPVLTPLEARRLNALILPPEARPTR
jgi:tetratricopeptide (TPR) repeat protein